MRISLGTTEVDDGIKNPLAGSVIGDVPAALCVKHVDAKRFVFLGRFEQIVVAATVSERNRRGVLKNQDGVGNFIRLPRFEQAVLQIEPLLIRDGFIKLYRLSFHHKKRAVRTALCLEDLNELLFAHIVVFFCTEQIVDVFFFVKFDFEKPTIAVRIVVDQLGSVIQDFIHLNNFTSNRRIDV